MNMNETSRTACPPRASKKLLVWLGFVAAGVGLVTYWMLGCGGWLPLGARYCYPRRSHVVELLGCIAMEHDEIAATRLRGRRISLFGFPDIELQMEVSQERLDDLAHRCGRLDGLDAGGHGAVAVPLGHGRYAVTIRRETGLRQH